ncbi:glycosyltransferase [Daejeonella sp.]|uniref:glycosyltransferase n=1 Tax=Daejeonella sp. TaxID=2805397 RepID=UPI0027199BFE|nr:glycosyltransferase [Daejeonella sp.]MDO8994768.1 glycosyltransferase [Daejeonella sp.]MDP2412399.1 glycosyltransferase [Daejeonella sp.]
MLYHITIYFWIVIQVLIGYNLLLPLILFFFYKISGILKKQTLEFCHVEEIDYAIIVTAYEQTDLIPAAVSSILKSNYSKFLVYVVADKCDVSNLHFNDERIILLRPEQTLASNTASHFYAIRHFKREHTHLTIIDSDNLVDSGYLNELNKHFNKGFLAVQGIRKAKNLDTKIAALDAARDLYYHFYDGKVLFGLGSSATLSGSGMAFTITLFRECLENKEIRGAGFDKVLQYAIVKLKHRIAFAEKAIVYDEKTSASDQLVKQRSRWINTWFKYFSNGFKLLIKGLQYSNLNQFLFGLTLLRPPLFIFLILSMVCLILNIFLDPNIAIVWIFAFVCFITGFGITIFQRDTDPRIYKALITIPEFMFLQVLSLLKIKSANKISVATKHLHKKSSED